MRTGMCMYKDVPEFSFDHEYADIFIGMSADMYARMCVGMWRGMCVHTSVDMCIHDGTPKFLLFNECLRRDPVANFAGFAILCPSRSGGRWETPRILTSCAHVYTDFYACRTHGYRSRWKRHRVCLGTCTFCCLGWMLSP